MAEKNKGGRPPHEPTAQTRKQVESMAGFGIPERDIGRSIGISDVTLRKHYREELDLGTVKANTAVAQSLYKKATGDGASSVTAAIFWLKTRAGWKETVVNEHSGPDGGPIEVSDARERIAGRIAKLAAAERQNGGSGRPDE